MDFIETITLTGTRMYVLAVIEHASRCIRVLGATAHPTATGVAQAARNLVKDLEDAGCQAKYLIRDRDGKYPAAFDAVLADARITVVRSGVRVPRMNSIMERWVRTCRRELLDRTLIWNQRHLLHALREYYHSVVSRRPGDYIGFTKVMLDGVTGIELRTATTSAGWAGLSEPVREIHAGAPDDPLLGTSPYRSQAMFNPLWIAKPS